MHIKEAIQHCEKVAAGKTEQGKCPECAEDHKQLAEWLRELVALRAQQARTLDRSRWEGCEMCSTECDEEGLGEGGAHDFRINDDALYFFDTQFGWEGITIKYCRFCGRPLTEEAWAELERRITGG